MSHQAALSMELQASVDEFLRTGGTITRLNYAGVPIDPELSAKDTPAYSQYGRNYRPRTDLAAAPAPVPMPRMRVEQPVTTVEQKAAFVEFLTEVLAPARAIIEERVNTAILEAVNEPRCFYTELRALRADAQRALAQLNRLVESV